MLGHWSKHVAIVVGFMMLFVDDSSYRPRYYAPNVIDLTSNRDEHRVSWSLDQRRSNWLEARTGPYVLGDFAVSFWFETALRLP